ncbi:MAG: LamG-like jellyroll fold domain-containing protein, partial [Planctomycetia bacterium]|nr:LamG-like jellyroll fold domain-containing protein [Planctomycetia bacterium]
MVGNRKPSGTLSNGDEGYNFIKVMSTELGYGANNSIKNELFNTGSPLPTDGTWVQCTVTKVGNRITYYQNGVSVGSITTANTMQANDFSFGGDWNQKIERAAGKLSDVRVYDTGMSATQVRNLYNIYRESYLDGAAARMSSDTLKLYDNFHSGIDSDRWSVVNRGLESSGVGTFSASVNADGQLVLEGVMDSTAGTWDGVCLQTKDTYSATAGEEEIVIHVKRFSLEEVEPNSTGVRSGIYLRDSLGKYFLFAQNTEIGSGGNYGWTYNVDIGGGGNGTRYTDLGYHDVALKYDGSQVFMYLDGQLVGSTAMTLGEFSVSLMASARAAQGQYSTVNDAVKAVFDTPTITYRNIANIPVSTAQLQDTFSGNTLSEAWKSTGTATVGNGVLRLTNASDATFQMPYYSNEDFTISVNRDSMRITPGATSGLKLVSEDGAWLSVFQSGTTGEWFLEWNGMDLAFNGAASLNSGSESLLTTDWMTHQILLDSVFDS